MCIKFNSLSIFSAEDVVFCRTRPLVREKKFIQIKKPVESAYDISVLNTEDYDVRLGVL